MQRKKKREKGGKGGKKKIAWMRKERRGGGKSLTRKGDNRDVEERWGGGTIHTCWRLRCWVKVRAQK